MWIIGLTRWDKRRAAAVSILEAIANLAVQGTLRYAYSQPIQLPQMAASGGEAIRHEPRPKIDSNPIRTFQEDAWGRAFGYATHVIMECDFAAATPERRVKIYAVGDKKVLKVLRAILKHRATATDFEVTDESMAFYYTGITMP